MKSITSNRMRNGELPRDAESEDAIRVIFVTDIFYPELAGGLRRIFRYGPFLRGSGVDFHVFTILRDHHGCDFEEVSGIRIHRLKPSGELSTHRERDYLLRMARLWLKEVERMPCVFLTMTASPGALRALEIFWMRLHGMPSVYALTDVAPRIEVKRLRGIYYRSSLFLTTFAYQRFYALSEEMRRSYGARLRFPGKKIEVIPNGVDLSRFHPASEEERAEARDRFRIASSDLVVLFVGALVERKRVHVLLEAWDQIRNSCPDAVLLLVGDQEERATQSKAEKRANFLSYREKLDELIKGSRVPRSILVFPEMEDVETAYHASDIFALPTESEGLPNVLLEAMASGLPSAVSPFDGLPRDGEELGNRGESFICVDGGADDWADEISGLLSNQPERSAVARQARAKMEKQQDLELVTERLAESLRQIARTPRIPR